jgi:parallel beta-helix repeat protein
LFVGTCIIPTIAQDTEKKLPLSIGNTIYVDDDNTEGPWDGSIEHPFQFITDGITAANPGDTVYVLMGMYYGEYIKIDKPITLEGENKYLTKIDFGSHLYGLRISSDSVQINNISIYRSSSNIYGGVAIDIQKTDNNIISNNIIGSELKNIPTGIECYQTSDNFFYNNIIKNVDTGIDCRQNGNYFIFNNNISAKIGVYLSESSHSKVFSNTFSCSQDIGLYDSYYCVIKNNNFLGGNLYYVSIGFLTRNLFIRNYWAGPYEIPKIIHCSIFIPSLGIPGEGTTIPWFDFDFLPRKSPINL